MMSLPSDYLHDVFISYRRDDPVKSWVQNHFYPLFEQWFRESIPHDRNPEPSVFIDKNLETGTQWADELQQALLHSRCIICIWSPAYFRQKWCLAEWQTMLERERLLKQRPDARPRLIFPIRYTDGESFPHEARSTQFHDLSAFNCPAESFRATKRYPSLHKAVSEIAKTVAQMVLEAPLWDPNWPVVDPAFATLSPEPVIPLKRL